MAVQEMGAPLPSALQPQMHQDQPDQSQNAIAKIAHKNGRQWHVRFLWCPQSKQLPQVT